MENGVSIRILKTEPTDIDELVPFQGKLKTLSDENFNKLRKSIVDEGFTFTVHVWENGGKKYIIDGHQRVSVLTQMRKQGMDIPPIPCSYVSAETYHDAKKLVLLAVSQYGKLDKEGFQGFTEGEEFEFDDFDFPDTPPDFLSFDGFESEPEETKEKQNQASAEEKLEKYLKREFLEIKLVYKKENYEDVILALDAYTEAKGLDSFSEAIAKLLGVTYENDKNREV